MVLRPSERPGIKFHCVKALSIIEEEAGPEQDKLWSCVVLICVSDIPREKSYSSCGEAYWSPRPAAGCGAGYELHLPVLNREIYLLSRILSDT